MRGTVEAFESTESADPVVDADHEDTEDTAGGGGAVTTAPDNRANRALGTRLVSYPVVDKFEGGEVTAATAAEVAAVVNRSGAAVESGSGAVSFECAAVVVESAVAAVVDISVVLGDLQMDGDHLFCAAVGGAGPLCTSADTSIFAS